MQYSPDALRAIIRTACLLIDKWTPEAEELLLGTAAKESYLGGLGLIQIGGGPALGPWQMEPATLRDIWFHVEGDLLDKVREVTGVSGPDEKHLQYNPIYGAIMTRLHYIRIPEPLPAVSDILGQADYWDVHYNRNPHAGFPQEYVELYYKLVLDSK